MNTNNDNETLLHQLVDDLQDLFDNDDTYYDLKVKKSFDGDDEISYPSVIVSEIQNDDVDQFFDGAEHIVDVAYQFDIYADQTIDSDAESNVRNIINIIRNYMRGERYRALHRVGATPIITLQKDSNIKIGFMRYEGRIDIDNNIIYRR